MANEKVRAGEYDIGGMRDSGTSTVNQASDLSAFNAKTDDLLTAMKCLLLRWQGMGEKLGPRSPPPSSGRAQPNVFNTSEETPD